MIGISNNKTTKADLTLYNGEYILDSICTNYTITEELNGEYSFDGNFLISDKINKSAYDLMINDSLLTVDDEYGTEYFRIAKVSKNKKQYEIFARHITISETLKMFCEDVRPTNLNGNGAINWIFNNSRGNKWIEVSSDITNVNTAYYKRKTVYEVLFDSDNSFLDRWGGEVYRRGFRLSINTRVGQDRGVSIRSGKNLKGIEERSNLNTLITSIYPIGFDGITIPEKYVNSDYINNYSDIYPAEVKFDDVKVKTENNEDGFDTLEEAQAELRRRAKLMFTKDKVDILTSSYEITFAELKKAEGYKDYSILETTFLGDIVSVYEEKLGIDIKVRVTKRVYDGIKKRRESTTLSNKDLNYKPPSISQIVDKLKNINDTETVLNLAKEQATALIKGGLKNSHVIVRPNEIIIGDTKNINTMTKVWRFNNAGLGYSSTGYFGEFGLAMTVDGVIVADFVKTGVLSSFNGDSWINMTSGIFDFAKGALAFDGTNLSIIGKILNVYNGYGVELDRGGLTFVVEGETVAGIKSTRFESNTSINGINIGNTRDGDYIGLGFTDSENFEGDSAFTDMIRLVKTLHPLLGNFKGIHLRDHTLLNANKIFTIQSQAQNPTNWHEIFNTTDGNLAIFGDNGILLGYKAGANKEPVFEIRETPTENGSQVLFYKKINMLGNTLTNVLDIFTGPSAGRFYNENWCGSIEATAKRISNLNIFYDSGWYAYSDGANGAPSNYGILLHFKWNSQDFVQIAFDFANTMYQRAWVNGAWTSWTQR